jgi:hypothetical protein
MDYVTRQFINLTKKFRKELRLFVSNLTKALEKQTEAIRYRKQSEEPRYAPPPAPTIVNFPESIEVRQETESAQKESLYRLVTILVSGVSVGSLIVYATLVYWQYKQMIVANITGGKAADAARVAACIADQTLKRRPYEFRVEQRPYVTLDEFRLTTDVTVINPHGESRLRLAFFNSGKTPALDFVLDPSRFDVMVGNTKVKVIVEKSSIGFKGVVGAGKPIIFELPFALYGTSKSQYEANALLLKAQGIVQYTDIFERRHQTKFCAQNRHDWGGAFVICGGYGINDIDREDPSGYAAETDCK